jgi:hypothetical protein
VVRKVSLLVVVPERSVVREVVGSILETSVVDVGASKLTVIEDAGLPVARNWRHFKVAPAVDDGFGR